MKKVTLSSLVLSIAVVSSASFLAAVISSPAHAAVTQTQQVNHAISAAQWATLINLSGKQRMLTQRMSKQVLLIALDIDKQKNITLLKNTSELFDKTLQGLRYGNQSLGLVASGNARINKQLSKIEELWKPFNSVLQNIINSGTVSKLDVDFIANKNLPLLKQMNRAVRLFEKAQGGGKNTTNALATTINLAGKQRMLTQKMSKEFLLIAYGYDVVKNQKFLKNTYDLFSRTLTGLETGDQLLGLPKSELAAANKQLAVVNKMWLKFEPYMQEAVLNKTVSLKTIKAVAAENIPLLKAMNAAVTIYANSVKPVK